MEGLQPAYCIEGRTVIWDHSADGYRLPTEAEWEYACRAGTTMPFNTENSISAEEANYYGHSAEAQNGPTGAETGTRRVYGGGWNDFAKNMRSAYRATMAENKNSFNIGIRLVRNSTNGSGSIVSRGNTKGIAEEIQSQTGADLFEITVVNPYSTDYNTLPDEAQRDQKEQARPELANHVENTDEYDTIFLGYPKVMQIGGHLFLYRLLLSSKNMISQEKRLFPSALMVEDVLDKA